MTLVNMIMKLSPEGDSLCVVVNMSKAPKLNTIISDDCCCAGNQAFEDVQLGAGTDWVQCVYTIWLHEECVIDCILYANGNEKLCIHFI